MSTNIIKHNFSIDTEHYNKKFGHFSGVLWLTGLSGSGKSTIANLACENLFDEKTITIIDGDDVRSGLNQDLGFSSTDRSENLRRVANVAKLFSDKGFITLCSFISPLKEQREKIKEIVGSNFHEVYIKTELAACESRDPKGLYKKARSGEIKNFTGIDAPYEAPEQADLIIETKDKTPEESAAILIDYINKIF